jgi:hypothetical protein
MILQLEIIGTLLIVLALIHVRFPKRFDWETDLKPLSLINKQMMYVHTFFVAFVVLLMGILCVTSPHELVETVLGKRICLGFGIFWGLRLYIQFFGYSSKLWKGKRFETAIHIVFSFLWVYLTAVFLNIAVKY